MGRMLRVGEWNAGILLSPWVDNGVELSGSHFFSDAIQLDYAAYAIGGPRGANEAADFDYKLSRSGELYYVDNNSRPSVGARVALNLIRSRSTVTAGLSAMAGTYDPEDRLSFAVAGADLLVQFSRVFLRAEYLVRRTEMALGSDPALRFKYGPGKNGRYDPYFLKQASTPSSRCRSPSGSTASCAGMACAARATCCAPASCAPIAPCCATRSAAASGSPAPRGSS
jgi:hypothetical protein